ncbi:MAG: SEC59/DGK1/VTE5 family protein [Thermoplasmata archaeon]
MTAGDMTGLLFVYLYVVLLIFISEKVLKNHLAVSRKFLHIMVGNILFILPFFDTQWVMIFLAAAPFIFLTFIMSPYSPVEIGGRTSSAGHSLGLVFYSISWTILAIFFFDRPEIIAVGIIAMSYGDGFAALIGQRFGKMKFNILGDQKSVEGSTTMFIVTLTSMILILPYFDALPSSMWIVLPATAAVATIAEATVPKGLDNISASLSAVIFYYVLVYVVML